MNSLRYPYLYSTLLLLSAWKEIIPFIILLVWWFRGMHSSWWYRSAPDTFMTYSYFFYNSSISDHFSSFCQQLVIIFPFFTRYRRISPSNFFNGLYTNYHFYSQFKIKSSHNLKIIGWFSITTFLQVEIARAFYWRLQLALKTRAYFDLEDTLKQWISFQLSLHEEQVDWKHYSRFYMALGWRRIWSIYKNSIIMRK